MPLVDDNLPAWERTAACMLYGASVVALSSAHSGLRLAILAPILGCMFWIGYRTDLGRSGFLKRAFEPTPERAARSLLGVFFVKLIAAVVLFPPLLLGMMFVYPLFITSPGMQAAYFFLNASTLAFGIQDERWIGDARVAVFAVLLGATFALHHHCERVRKNRAPYRASALRIALTGASFGLLAAAAAFPLHFLIPTLAPPPPLVDANTRPPSWADLFKLLGYFGAVSVLFAIMLRLLQRMRLMGGAGPQLERVSASVTSQEAMLAEAPAPARPREARWTVVKLYHHLFERLRASGVLALPSSTPTERTTTLARRAPERGEEIERLTELFQRARYSTEAIGPADVQRMKGWTEAVRRAAQGVGVLVALWAGTALAQDPAWTDRVARILANRAHTYDIVSYDLDVTIDPEAHLASVIARVVVEAKKESPTLRFLLHRNARVSEVRCGEAKLAFQVSRFVPQLPCYLLDVTPAAPLAKGDRTELMFEYAFPSPSKPEVHAPTVEDEFAYVDLATGWYPLMLYEVFESRITLHLPEGWEGVATGGLQEMPSKQHGPRTLTFEGPQANAMLGFICGKYKSWTHVEDGRHYHILAYTDLREATRDVVFKEVAELFRYYTSLYGEPGIDEFTVVEMPPNDPSRPHNVRTYAALTADEWVHAGDEDAAGKPIWYGALSHEIAHCWFGHLVTSDVLGRGGNWLREGLAEYSSYLALEKRFGAGAWLFRRAQAGYRRDLEAMGAQEPSLRDVSYVYDHDTSYEKGAWVFRMLRHEVGEEAFSKTVRAYVAEKRGAFALDTDFRAIAERESGRDLGAFFAAWEEGTGRMDLAVAAAPVAAEKGWKVHVDQVGTLAWPARVTVRWRLSDGAKGECEADVPAAGGDVLLPCAASPAMVEVDARNDYMDIDTTNNTWPHRLKPGMSTIFVTSPAAGEWVASVEEGSPAASAGLRVGDFIIAQAKQRLRGPDDLGAALWGLLDGGSLRLLVRRRTQEVEAILK